MSLKLLGARTLLGAPGLTPSNKKLLGAPGIATRSNKASSNKCIASSNKCLTSSNKKLLGTVSSLVKFPYRTNIA